MEEGIPVNTGPPWSRKALDEAIHNGPHASACAPDMVSFIRGELRRRIQDGFSILLSAEDAVRLFGEQLKLSRIAAVPQAQRRPRLILNLSAPPDKETPSVNDTTDREIAPESMQFGRAFPRILQAIWEADPAEGPVRVSKLDVTDAYHRGTLKPSQVGAFAYVVPSVPEDDAILICIDLVLPMGWVDSPKFFCAFSETLTDVANTLVYADLPVPAYGAISALPATEPAPFHTPASLTHIDCYMDDVIAVAQGGAERQHRVFDSTVRALKWLFPSIPGEAKDLVSVKKLFAGEGDWECVKEVLG